MFKRGKKEGIGIYTRKDGSYYKGAFFNDLKHGYGVFKGIEYDYEG